jgi:hypothetical protein
MTRKIEQEMVAALRKRRAWRQDNTEVQLDRRQDGKPLALVFLHGNHIATLGYDEAGKVMSLSWTLAGWETRTTVSRINAILEAFGAHWERVGFKNFEPELRTRGGVRGLDAFAWELTEVQS